MRGAARIQGGQRPVLAARDSVVPAWLGSDPRTRFFYNYYNKYNNYYYYHWLYEFPGWLIFCQV